MKENASVLWVYTLFPVSRILHQGGYTKEEQLEFRAVIYGNILQSALALIRGMEMLNIDFGAASAQVSHDSEVFISHAQTTACIFSVRANQSLWKANGSLVCVDDTAGGWTEAAELGGLHWGRHNAAGAERHHQEAVERLRRAGRLRQSCWVPTQRLGWIVSSCWEVYCTTVVSHTGKGLIWVRIDWKILIIIKYNKKNPV